MWMKKTLLLTLFSSLLLMLLASLTLYHDATHSALTRLNIKRIVVSSYEIPESLDGLDIVYFSDTHIFSHENLDFIASVFDSIQREHPDILIFGGDFIDASVSSLSDEQMQFLNEQLSKLDASKGKFAVLGDDDLKHIDTIRSLYQSYNIEILDGHSTLIRNQDDSGLCLSNMNAQCLDSPYTISVFYDPDDYSNALNADLALLAKTHGGQVSLPLFGASYSKASGSYIKGEYLEGQTHIYVSSGVATLEFQARLFNDPSIYVFTLNSK